MALTTEDIEAIEAVVRRLLRDEIESQQARGTPNACGATMISQNNCEAAIGLTPRQYLDLLRRDDAPPAARVGKLRMVRTDVLVAYVLRLDAKTREPVEDEAGGVDAVLREVGCAPVRRMR